MEFWRGNRASAEFDRPIDQLARQFWASPQGIALLRGHEIPLDHQLRRFLADPQGLNSIWDSQEDYDALFELVRGTWPKPVAAEADTSEAVPGRVSDSVEHGQQ